MDSILSDLFFNYGFISLYYPSGKVCRFFDIEISDIENIKNEISKEYTFVMLVSSDKKNEDFANLFLYNLNKKNDEKLQSML
jgi:hypothetical protein